MTYPLRIFYPDKSFCYVGQLPITHRMYPNYGLSWYNHLTGMRYAVWYLCEWEDRNMNGGEFIAKNKRILNDLRRIRESFVTDRA